MSDMILPHEKVAMDLREQLALEEDLILTPPVFGGTDTIFNRDREYQGDQPLFFSQDHGLVDSINVRHQELWDLRDKMQRLDWRHDEHEFGPCRAEFAAMEQAQADVGMLTLGWQWEGDSVAAHSVMPIISLYFPAEPVFVLYQRIGDNESIHGLTYARIQKQAFVDATQAMDRILKLKESYQRIDVVAQIFARAKYFGHLLQLGMVKRTDYQVREALFLFLVALFCLERIQFMSSFSITHTMAEQRILIPITGAVRKIANDEYNVHVPSVRYLIRDLMQTWGADVMARSRHKVIQVINSIFRSEASWSEFTFSEGRSLDGTNFKRVLSQVSHCATDAAVTLGLTADEVDFEMVYTNPHPNFMMWININATAPSPQENRGDNYVMGGITEASAGAIALDNFDL